MPNFVDSTFADHRPLNVPAARRAPPYDSGQLARSISTGALQEIHASPRAVGGAAGRTLQRQSTDVPLPFRQAWDPTQLATPAATPRLFVESGEIPTNAQWAPVSRLLSTTSSSFSEKVESKKDRGPMVPSNNVVDASLPFNVPVNVLVSRVEQAGALFAARQERVLARQLRERTVLQKTADSAKRRAWITRAVSMLPRSDDDSTILQALLQELAGEHWTANARSCVEYELLEPRSLLSTGIDRTALRPPPIIWTDARYKSFAWRVLRQTPGVSRDSIMLAYAMMCQDLHQTHILPTKLQRAWDAVNNMPIRALCDEDCSLLVKTNAANPSTAAKTSTHNDEIPRLSFSCMAQPSVRRAFPLSLEDFNKAVKQHAQSVRDQLLRGWLGYAQERFAMESVVSEVNLDGMVPKKGKIGLVPAPSKKRGAISSSSSNSGVRKRKTALKKASSFISASSPHQDGHAQKNRESPMMESIRDLRRRYEALGEDEVEGDGLIQFQNQGTGIHRMKEGHLGKSVEHSKNHQEIEGWVSGLANLKDGIAGGANRKHKDEVREALVVTQTVLSHPDVLRRQPLPNDIINKSADQRRDDLVNSATTLLSRQLRSMVDASVEDFVSFFHEALRQFFSCDQSKGTAKA
jgi:hypothetical protein